MSISSNPCSLTAPHRAGIAPWSSPGRALPALFLTVPLMLNTHAAAAPSAPESANLPVADARTPVPPVIHRSAIPRPAPSTASPSTAPTATWVESNRLVDQIGGWKAYLREAHGSPAPAPAITPTATPTVTPTATPPAPARAPEAKR